MGQAFAASVLVLTLITIHWFCLISCLHVCAWQSAALEYLLVRSDLREECVKECEDIARRMNLHEKAFFAAGDMREVKQTVDRFRSSCVNGSKLRFGGMFTSIPFWTLETVS